MRRSLFMPPYNAHRIASVNRFPQRIALRRYVKGGGRTQMSDSDMAAAPELSEIHERLRLAREMAGFKHATHAAKALHITTTTYANYEGGFRNPKVAQKALTFSTFFNCDLEWFLTGVGEPCPDVHKSTDEQTGEQSLNRLSASVQIRIVGRVAASVFVEQDTNQEAEMDLSNLPISPFPPDPLYPIRSQFDLVVQGTSIDRFARDGDRIRCVKLVESGLEWADGDLVVVERRRDGLLETTAKRIWRKNGSVELWPDSDDMRWQTPIVLSAESTESNDSISITALVLWSYRPARPSMLNLSAI